MQEEILEGLTKLLQDGSPANESYYNGANTMRLTLALIALGAADSAEGKDGKDVLKRFAETMLAVPFKPEAEAA